MELFPGRGIRDVTAQLKSMGLIKQKKKSRVPEPLPLQSDSDSEPEWDGMESGHSELDHLVSQLHSEGYSDELSWLEAYLCDEARDRRADDEWESLCVVPVSDGVATALPTASFKKLLSMLKLQPPSQEEQYWKIPSTLSPDQLEDSAKSLQNRTSRNYEPSPDRELTRDEALSALLRSKGGSPPTQLPQEAPLTQLPHKAQAAKKPRLTRRGSFFDDSDSETEYTCNANFKQKRVKAVTTRSDTELGIAVENSIKKEQQRKRRHLDLFSSESEEEEQDSPTQNQVTTVAPSNTTERKRVREIVDSSSESNSESESSKPNPAKKPPQYFDSDSETEGLVMDLSSPVTNTVEFDSVPNEQDQERNMEAGSMEPLALSQSVMS